MGQVRLRGQGDLLPLMEPVPTLPAKARAALVPLMAALLLQAVAAEGARTDGGDADTEREGRDEQGRA
jgi:hypothetical protein